MIVKYKDIFSWYSIILDLLILIDFIVPLEDSLNITWHPLAVDLSANLHSIRTDSLSE